MTNHLSVFGTDCSGKSTVEKTIKRSIIPPPESKHLLFENSPKVKVLAARLIYCMHDALNKAIYTENGRFSSQNTNSPRNLENELENKQSLLKATQEFLEVETKQIIKVNQKDLQKNSQGIPLSIVEGSLFLRVIATFFSLYPTEDLATFSEYEKIYRDHIILPILLISSEEKQVEILEKRRENAKFYEESKKKFPCVSNILDVAFLSAWFDFVLLDSPSWRKTYAEIYGFHTKRIFPGISEYNMVENNQNSEETNRLLGHLEQLKNGKK